MEHVYVPLHALSILEATQEVTAGVPLHPPEQCQRRANKTRGLNKTQSHPTLCPKCPGYTKNENNLKRNKKRWPQTQHGMTPTSELSDKDSEAATIRTITRNKKSHKETETIVSRTCGTIAKGRMLMLSDHQKETGRWVAGRSIQKGNG